LTESLYVPAALSSIDSVIIDIGTGYYSEKSVADAGGYYKARMEYLKQNIVKLQETMYGKRRRGLTFFRTEKQKSYQMVVEVMQMKIAQQQQQQQQGGQAAGSSE
jgi:prefoldin alpha subunit